MKPEEYDVFLCQAEERQYLRNNSDVARAISEGVFSSGKDHYETHGKGEGRPWPNFHLHNKIPILKGGKHAIFISTYCPANFKDKITQRLPETLRTLRASAYPGDIWIVDDGSTHPLHLKLLDSLPPNIRVIRHKERGGISRAKNSGILKFREMGYSFGFLSDDDNHFDFGWWETYIHNYEMTGLQHLCWGFGKETKTRLTELGYPPKFSMIGKNTILSGILMTITQEIIQKVGGFKVLPSPWGFEHLDYTDRIVKAGIIPFGCDILEADRFIRPNVYSNYSSSPIDEHLLGYHQNPIAAANMKDIYVEPEGGSI
jgi:hypothetical protein